MVDEVQAAPVAEATPKDPMVVYAEEIQSRLADGIISFDTTGNELVFLVKRDSLLGVMAYLRDADETQFKQLIDICGVDYPNRAERFEVVYQLLSMRHNIRARVKITTDEETPVPSLSTLFSSAPWCERETWDMYGIMFDGLADHRRILTDYGFDGHPLRKDFPLSGNVEVRYDAEQKRVVYGPVTLPQDFRVFDNLSPWEALTDIQVPRQLPGDEKAAINPNMPKIGWHPTAKTTE